MNCPKELRGPKEQNSSINWFFFIVLLIDSLISSLGFDIHEANEFNPIPVNIQSKTDWIGLQSHR